MMQTTTTTIALAFALVGIGCGGDSGEEFEGTYRVTRHVSGDCQVQETAEPGDFEGNDFFRLELDSFLGVPFLGYKSCTSASSCAEDSNLFSSFFKEDGAFVLKVSSATGTEPDCDVTAARGSIDFNGAGELEIEITTKTGIINADDCFDALDLVDARFESMTCERIETMTGAAL